MRAVVFWTVTLWLALPVAAQEPPTAPMPPATPALEQPRSEAPAPDAREIVRRAMLLDNENREVARNYTYRFRSVTHELEKDGREKKTTIRTFEHFVLFGHGFNKLVAKNDKPLTAEDERKEDERYRKFANKWQHESEGDRAKRIKSEQDERQLRLKVPEAFDFKLLASEEVNGRGTWRVFATPRRDFHPDSLQEKLLAKMQGTIWIDKADYAWAKVDVEMIGDFGIGGFLFKLYKGTRLQFDQVKLNDEIWLPHSQTLSASARAMWKSARINSETTFSDYRKFKADTKITGVSEMPAERPAPPPHP